MRSSSLLIIFFPFVLYSGVASAVMTVVDYFVTELWDVTLPGLECQPSSFVEDGKVNSESTESPAISFPVKESKIFVQNTPFTGRFVCFRHNVCVVIVIHFNVSCKSCCVILFHLFHSEPSGRI